jgi:protein tyrosine phosphatase (PTP) superfamily phosphohydrolase (DUF442 family)
MTLNLQKPLILFTALLLLASKSQTSIAQIQTGTDQVKTGTADTKPLEASFLPRKILSAHLPNLVQVAPGIYSGGLPESSESFDELKKLGIKTILSVDGAKPDLEAADNMGLRYVHIPHGYDGIPTPTVERLAKAISELPGPIYMHCHHGKHRSPAAAAAACKAQGMIDQFQAEAVLKLAGTNRNYKGLYQAVKDTELMSTDRLAVVSSDFPSVAPIAPLVDAMVHLEETFTHLQQLSESDWNVAKLNSPTDYPNESLLLREHYDEMLRLEVTKSYPGEFTQMLQASQFAAWRLESMLHQPLARNSEQLPKEHIEALRNNWLIIKAQCIQCHQAYRDNR